MLSKLLIVYLYFSLDLIYYFWTAGSKYEISTILFKISILLLISVWIYFSSKPDNNNSNKR